MALSLLAFLVLVQSAVYCSVVNKNIFVDIDRPPWQNIPEVSTVDEVTVSEMHSVTLLLRYPADPTPTGSTKEALQLQHRLYDTFREYPQIMVARQPSSSTHRTVTEELELISNAGNKLITTPFTSGLLTLDNQARVEQFVRARVRIRKHEYESGILSRQSTFDALRSMNTIINQYLYPTDTKESGETEAMTTKAKKEPRNRERREEAERKMAKLLAEKEEVDALLLELEAVTAKRADKAAVEEEVQALTKLIEQLRNRQQALATKVTANNADTENNDEHRTNEHDGARVGRHSLLEKLDVALKELQWTSYGAEHATYGVLTREILQRALAEDWELQHFKDEIERMEEEKQAVPQGLISLKNEEAALRAKRREMKGKDNSDSRASIYSSIRASRKKIQKEIKLVIAYKKQIDQRIAILHSFTQRIPRIVHFIKTDIHTDRFSLQNYLAVAAAHFMIKPDAIYYHMHPKTAAAQDRANNQWWDRCREYVTIVAEDDFVTQTRTGAPVRLAAHQADFLRVRYLIQEGGIYMDTDVLALRDFDDLLSNNVVFGAEKLVPRYMEVMGVALMLSTPNAPFMVKYADRMQDEFTPDCYACHSTVLAKSLAVEYPEEIQVLNYTSFYHPGWEDDAMDLMFNPDRYVPNIPNPVRNGLGYAIHLFQSGGPFLKWSPTLTEELILKQDTFFNVIFRPFLGQGRYSSKEAAAMYEERMAAGENVDPNNVFPEGHITIKSPPQATVVEDDDTYEYDDDDYEYAIDDINAANAYDDW